jgi:hypothetical protein
MYMIDYAGATPLWERQGDLIQTGSFYKAVALPVVVQSGENGIRFLLVSGQPLREPVAWYGPIVMNTQDELRRAFDELERGTFLNHDRRSDGRPIEFKRREYSGGDKQVRT